MRSMLPLHHQVKLAHQVGFSPTLLANQASSYLEDWRIENWHTG